MVSDFALPETASGFQPKQNTSRRIEFLQRLKYAPVNFFDGWVISKIGHTLPGQQSPAA
jgi:hypothetical protein